MRMLGVALVSALVAGVVAATVTQAATSSTHVVTLPQPQPHILGRGGQPPPLDPFTCHRRTYNLAAGSSWRRGGRRFTVQGLSILGNQTRCLVRLVIARQRCFVREPFPQVVARYDHGVGQPGDWLGVDKVVDRLTRLRKCLIAAHVIGLRGH